ncbi:MAG: recombinase family protein [Acidimicrobiales bacterium]
MGAPRPGGPAPAPRRTAQHSWQRRAAMSQPAPEGDSAGGQGLRPAPHSAHPRLGRRLAPYRSRRQHGGWRDCCSRASAAGAPRWCGRSTSCTSPGGSGSPRSPTGSTPTRTATRRRSRSTPPAPSGAWSRSSVWEVLRNPKYTGHQVWNRRARKKGHNRENPRETWIWSDGPAHPALVSREEYKAVQGRATATSTPVRLSRPPRPG